MTWRGDGASRGCSISAAAPAFSRLPPRALCPARGFSPPTTTPSPPPWRGPTRGSTALRGGVRVVDAAGFGHALLRRARPFDLVLANILAGTLIELAPAMRRAVRPGGIAVLSGLLTTRPARCARVYRASGFQLMNQRQRDDWTALTLLRR